jgi:type II secretory ATPase GspE/PulE/Tfp pilus assembly ATPase PilB-like protein
MLAIDFVLAAERFVPAGGYISTIKVIPVLLLLLLWARLLGWADTDAQAAHLPRIKLNLINLSGMAVAFALFFVVPMFILAFPILLVVMGAEVGVYLMLRHKTVGLKDLDKQFKEWKKGIKGKEKATAAAGRVAINGKDGKPLPIPEGDSPDRPAYDAIQKTLTTPLICGAQQVDLAPEGEAMAVKFVVDNFTHRGATIDFAEGQAAVSYIKWAGGLNVEDKRKPQTANVKVALDKDKHELKVQTAGTTAGEYLRIIVDPKIRHAYKLNALGFTEAQQKVVEELVKDHKGGIVLLSAPKGHGLTSLFYTILRSHDAFLEHAQTIEHDQEQDLEGITQTALPPNAPAGEEFKKIDWAISQEPHVLGVSRMLEPKSAAATIAFAKSGKRVYVCMRANSTFEAIDQWKRLAGGDSARATEALRMAINGRVLRKLCGACKEEFTPDPATLKKLNLSAEKVTTLFKARETAIRDAKGVAIPCTFCNDLKFKGRMGVYEVLIVDAELRQTLDANKPLNQAFRKQRGRYLQEEALTLVEKGDTSVQEVLRILKPAPEGATAAPASSAAPAGRAAPGKAVRNR